MLGIVLIDKPLGITSHDVIGQLRRRFETRRVGHAGTLDPLATGLLVVAIGPATRFLQYLPLEPKEYVASIRFGVATTTQDAEGEVVSEGTLPPNLREEFERLVPQYRGLIQQIPPIYSAVKKDGKPLYHYARKGIEVEREARTVHIGDVEILDDLPNEIEVRVTCSGGTYMRTWAHDIGQSIGCGAYLVGLRRTKVGRFLLSDASTLEEVGRQHLIPLSEALPPLPLLHLNSVQVDAVRHGQPIGMSNLPASRACGLLDGSGEVVGIGRIDGPMVHPEVVIPLVEVEA